MGLDLGGGKKLTHLIWIGNVYTFGNSGEERFRMMDDITEAMGRRDLKWKKWLIVRVKMRLIEMESQA